MDWFGFLLIDKSKGITSHDAVEEVRRKLGCKTGHTGTLDPFATGLLIMALGKATRLAEFIQKQNKEYEVEMVLGEERDSYDITGKMIERRKVGEISKEQITTALNKFKGKIMQKPPVYSAIKIAGVRAYRMASRGEIVGIKERPVEIYEIEISKIDLPSVYFRVKCSSGTYVRSLVHDVGLELKTLAYTKNLRRTAVGKYTVAKALPIDRFLELEISEIEKEIISPADALDFLPRVIINKAQYDDLINGKEIEAEVKIEEGLGLAVLNSDLVSVVNIFKKDGNVILKPDKVFIKKDKR